MPYDPSDRYHLYHQILRFANFFELKDENTDFSLEMKIRKFRQNTRDERCIKTRKIRYMLTQIKL